MLREMWSLRRFPILGFLLVLASGCKVGGCAANVLGDVVGATGDVACDRRFGKDPAPFCQEVIDTVAVTEVGDDCRNKHGAHTYEDKCPRGNVIAGCKIHKDNDDGSEVFDWYYDVSDLEDAAARDAASRDAGRSEVDGESDAQAAPPDAKASVIFKDPVTSKDAVRKLCADRTRYEEGATYVEP
jgi:hypothetical protein